MRLTFVVCNQNDDGSIVCIGQHSWRLAARYDLWDKDDISVSLKGRPKDSFPIMSSAGKELVCDTDTDIECHAPHAARHKLRNACHGAHQRPATNRLIPFATRIVNRVAHLDYYP